jgi:hypothetical protein
VDGDRKDGGRARRTRESFGSGTFAEYDHPLDTRFLDRSDRLLRVGVEVGERWRLGRRMTTDLHDTGRQIAAKYGYSMYDGLIAASALEAECDTLYSEDMHDGQVLEGRVTIRNPFVQ